MKLVEVTWEDAQCRDMGPWVDKQEWNYEPLIVKTVGYVLADDPRGLVLTESVHEFSTGAVQQIPRGMIVAITTLVKG